MPFLVGPSNSGKSTVLYPIDDLFGPHRVAHKPALGSSFGLRNIVSGMKRFMFRDDFRPVEFAHEKTVPVSVFLSLFIGQPSEIQVSQSFNDGNPDVIWQRGVAFTGKSEGLWEPTKRVSAEDIRHMRSRCHEFHFHTPLSQGSLRDVQPCPSCMCRWILRGAAAYDAEMGLRPIPSTGATEVIAPMPSIRRTSAIQGLPELLAVLVLGDSIADALVEDLENLGAARVSELTIVDWEAIRAWSVLRPLQRRRLLQHTGAS